MHATRPRPGAQSSMIPQILSFDTQCAFTFFNDPTAGRLDSRSCNFDSAGPLMFHEIARLFAKTIHAR